MLQPCSGSNLTTAPSHNSFHALLHVASGGAASRLWSSQLKSACGCCHHALYLYEEVQMMTVANVSY
jgi:hypothetical protein